jgi:hypothetical protein
LMTCYLYKWMKMHLQKVISTKILHGSKDPDPYQNITDPEHWVKHCACAVDSEPGLGDAAL